MAQRPRRKTHRYQSRPAQPAPTNAQAKILAGLNALEMLEAHAAHYLHDVIWYGAASFAGGRGKPWAGALIWLREKGWHTQTYQHLTLFGVWAAASEAGSTQLLVGTKPLQYSAPIYTPEAYHQLIKRGFQTYYDDDGAPPDGRSSVRILAYEPAQRLALRDTLSDAVRAWMIARSN